MIDGKLRRIVSIMEHVVNVSDIADFNLIAKYGGFGRAARESGRPKATLSRRVAELESKLQVRLIERGSNKVKLTDEGLALYKRTAPLFTELDEAVLAISSDVITPRGRLRVSAPLLFSQIAMGKLAAEFAMKYPEVQLDITCDDHITDMVEEGYDLVIRVNPAEDENLYGRMLIRDQLVAVATPNIKYPQENETIPVVVRHSTKQTNSWVLIENDIQKSIKVTPVLCLSSMMMVRDAIYAGAGPGLLPLSLVHNDLLSGKLTCWGKVDAPETALWALYPSRRLLNARVSAFLKHLKEAFPTGRPEELSAYI